MDIPGATFWWVTAGLAVAAELGTGTFYLLMIALGLAAAALAAHAGLAATAQIAVAALVGAGATVAWHLRRARQPTDLPPSTNRDVNLDVGERVHVDRWGADSTARVHYRGTGWTARLAPGAEARPGEHVVTAVEGNWLVLAPVPRTLKPT
jgi:membrane protein implicated in regulation of membrane protease activity